MMWFIALYTILFTGITSYRFRLGIQLLFLLLPTYLIRFNIGPLPTTLLEVMLGSIFLIWSIRAIQSRTILHTEIKTYAHKKTFFVYTFLFLLAATLALIPAVDLRAALGEWKAFYIEPILLFFLLLLSLHTPKHTRISLTHHDILFPLLLSGFVTSLLTLYQHTTGWMVPHAFWANGNSYRVTGWYGFPNGVGLFLAPLVPIAFYYAKKSYKLLRDARWKSNKIHLGLFFLSLISIVTLSLGVLYAKSTGGLIGILGACGILLLLYKKTRLLTLIIGITSLLLLFVVPQLDPLQTEVTFQDRSGQIRVAIYKETLAFLHDHPLMGAGLASYDERIMPYHQTVHGEGIEIFHHPHNIFLTLWVNTGILGLSAFIGILGTVFYSLYNASKDTGQTHFPFLLACLTTIVITGLVDSPYIKNDLAILFWGVLALSINYRFENKSSHTR